MDQNKNQFKQDTIPQDIHSKKPRIVAPVHDMTSHPSKTIQQELDTIINQQSVNQSHVSTVLHSPTIAIQTPYHQENSVYSPSEMPRTKKFLVHMPHPRSKKVIFAGVLFCVVVIAGMASVLLKNNKQPEPPKTLSVAPTSTPTPTPIPTPLSTPSTLSGLPVDPTFNKQPVTAVMIENSPEARPQSGLLQASIVYEAIAEGGITRFLALYQDQKADRLGPVRSLRPYYIDWLAPYDAPIAHVGGSADALKIVRNGEYVDLDQFSNSGTYDRISDRYAPHNVYTTTDRLISLAKSKGKTTSTFTSFLRKPDAPAAHTAKSIDITVSSYLYNVHYDYDAATNTYQRSQGAKPHTDEVSKKQLSPKVVIAMAVPNRAVQSSDGWRMDYTVNGSGKAIIYQDGVSQSVNWKKSSTKGALKFYDLEDKEVAINAGQTWITAIDSVSGAVSK